MLPDSAGGRQPLLSCAPRAAPGASLAQRPTRCDPLCALTRPTLRVALARAGFASAASFLPRFTSRLIIHLHLHLCYHSAHAEPVEGPLVLSLSKDHPVARRPRGHACRRGFLDTPAL